MHSRRALENINRPKPAPVEYAGQWVAWDHERTTVVAHGNVFKDVLDAARQAGHPQPILQPVPRADVRFIGAV